MTIDLDSFFDPNKRFMNRHQDDPEEHRTSQFSSLWRLARFVSWQGEGNKGNGLNNETFDFAGESIHSLPINEGFYESSKMLGLVLYLILLDQLSDIFPMLGVTSNPNENGIVRMLRQAGTPLQDSEMIAVKNLRNSLAHNFGLASKPENKDPYFRYSLDYSRHDSGQIITTAKSTASSDFGTDDGQMQTTISVPLLIEHIESILQDVIDKQKLSNYGDILKDKDELRVRFTTVYPKVMKESLRQLMRDIFGFKGSNVNDLLKESSLSFFKDEENGGHLPIPRQEYIPQQDLGWKAWRFVITQPSNKPEYYNLYNVQIPKLLSAVTEHLGLKMTIESETSQLKTFVKEGLVKFSIQYSHEDGKKVEWIEFTLWDNVQ